MNTTDQPPATPVRPYGITLVSAEPNTRTLRLAALPTAPGCARLFVIRTALDWQLPQEIIEVAELLVSELVTNAVKQTGRVNGPPTPRPTERVVVVIVRLRLIDGALRIDVWDHDHTPPVPVAQNLESEGGRGLFLVEMLARRWGCYTPVGRRAVGKVVWAEVAAC